MDKRKNNGGAREGAGRKPKSDEQAMIERLSPMDDDAFKALKESVKNNDSWAVKMFFEYRFGKPKQQIENTNINYNQELTAEEAKLINSVLDEKY